MGEPSRIALLTADNTPFVPAFLGILLAGAAAVVLDPKWTAVERGRALGAARPDLLITDLPGIDEGVPALAPFDLAGAPDARSIARFVDDDAEFLVTFTAGTTATPKGVVRSHRSWLASLAAARQKFPIAAGEAVLVPGPLAHSIFLFALVEALAAGAHVHQLPRFDAKAALAVIADHGIRRLTGVPTLYAALAERATADRRQFPSVTSLVSAGDKLAPALRTALAQIFPRARIVEYYGAAELSFVAAGSAEEGCPPEAVGRPLPGVRISLRDDDGQEVAAGAAGRLWVRSDMLALRYADGSNVADRDGWATVGDHARQDPDGWIYLVGRDDGMLISGGLNVYPAEIEAVLRSASAVADAVVLGLPDPYWGESIVAVVTRRNGCRPTRAELLAHCRERLAVYKCPKRFFEIDALPLMPSGKIARNSLRRMLLMPAGEIAELLG
jgi:acyl-CoA synthetase (AMP-forming)/AMP-acid ligase II